MKSILSVIFTLYLNISFSQGNDFFNRLQAIKNRDITFYNIDGIEITSQEIIASFSAKNIAKNIKPIPIKEAELISSDSSIHQRNFWIRKTNNSCKGTEFYTTFYFIENSNKTITQIIYNESKKQYNKDFHYLFNRLIINNEIPENIFAEENPKKINFAGNNIELGAPCRWMGVNNLQCSGNGQMNWSIHKDSLEAAYSLNLQIEEIECRNKTKPISDEYENVIFEGKNVIARKIVYKFKGVNSILVGVSGRKTLTAYFVTAPINNNYVSCVMSFWNNDNILPSGLPPLLNEVMQLKKE